MKSTTFAKISLIVSAVAFAVSAVVLILVLTGTNSKAPASETKKTKAVSDSTAASIAYINLDTLLLEYKYSIKLQEDFLTEQAKAKGNLEARYRAFEAKATAFQEKVRLGSFISQASMDSQQNELVQEQTNLQQLESDLSETLMEKQTAMNKELFDSVMNFVEEYNDGRFTFILGNGTGSNILYAQPDYDLTREVVDQLNERYDKSLGGK
jgi:outer membrane protein